MKGQVSTDVLPDQKRKVLILDLAEALSAAGLQALMIKEGMVVAVPFPSSMTPTLHAPTHQDGGIDEVNVQNLSGLLADPQTPLPHEITHRAGGTDELSVLNLGGFPGGTLNFLRSDATFAVPPGVPGGSDRKVQFNNAGAFEGAENITVVGNDAAGVLTLLKNFNVTNQKTAGASAETYSKIATGGPNTKGLRIEGAELASGTPWTPAQLSASVLLLWLDASQESFADGDPVSTWTDRSGNANHATQSGGQRPTFQTNEINGLPVVRFDDVDDYLLLTSAIALSTTAFNVLCVGRRTASTTYFPLGHVTAGDYSLFAQWSDNIIYVSSSDGSAHSAAYTGANGAIYSHWRRSGTTYTFQGGGQADTNLPFTFGVSHDITVRTIGYSLVRAEYTAGDFAEIIVLSSSATTADYERVRGYLAWKYGVQAQLIAGDPYQGARPEIPTPPTANLVEIGRVVGETQVTVAARGQTTIATHTATDVALTLQAAAAQTGYVLEVKNSAGVSLHGIKPAAAVTYVPSNDLTDRTMNANNLTLHEIADIVITMQRDLHARFGGFL